MSRNEFEDALHFWQKTATSMFIRSFNEFPDREFPSEITKKINQIRSNRELRES